MSKLHMASIGFLVLDIIALFPLTKEVWGHMNPIIIQVSAIFAGIGIVGASVCRVADLCIKEKKKA